MSKGVGYKIYWVQAMPNGTLSRSNTTTIYKDKAEADRLCDLFNEKPKYTHHWVQEVVRKAKEEK